MRGRSSGGTYWTCPPNCWPARDPQTGREWCECDYDGVRSLRGYGLGAAMPPAVTTLFQLYPGLQSGFEWIKGEVSSTAKRAVEPYVLGAYALGGVAFLVGVVALFRKK